MSLLNDMLQDLQQQPEQNPEKNREINDDNSRAQLKESGMIKTTSIPWLASALVFTGVLSVLLSMKHFYQKPVANTLVNVQEAAPIDSLSSTVSEVEDNNGETGSNEKQSSPVTALALPTNQSDDVPAQTLSTPELTSEEKIHIEQLLTLARQAVARDRLTSPFEDNAYTYYQKVLVIEPENSVARQGILQLADRYLAMAEKKWEAGNQESAYSLLQRAQLVAPEYPAVTAFAEQWQAFSSQESFDVDPEESRDFNVDARPESESVIVEQSVQENAESHSIQDPFNPSTEEPHFSLSPNAQWQDQRQVQDASLLLQQEKPAQAISALEQFIATNHQAVQSTCLLLDIYIEQKNVESAQRLLASATYLEKVDHQYYKARLALVNDQTQEAMVLLEAELPNAEKHEQYRALLAGIYQKAALYPQAATSYKRLLDVFGEKPAYWLGYALALDALEQKTSALQAYRRLSEYTQLQTEVRAYIEQRIAALQS